ncbi:MAG: hypothetical protein K6G28_02885 [Acholeplasmatales bacterium]|nr:hypothetical protein [Acholeplasmatales bacterium]
MIENTLNILFVIIITIVILLYLDNLFLSQDSKFYNKRHEQKIFEDANFKYDLFKRGAIIDVKNTDLIEIPLEYKGVKITQIDIKRKLYVNKFILSENINYIVNLDLQANEVVSNSSNFTTHDGAIFDIFNNVIVIYSEKSKDELFNLACNYSIHKLALNKFSNALYNQFVLYNGLYDLRFSKPYYEHSEDLYAIVPSRINGIEVESISINYAHVKELYIPASVKRVIIEKKSDFERLKISDSNKELVIFNNSLLQKNTGIYVNDRFNTFNLTNTENKKDFKANYRLFNRKYLLFKENSYKYSLVANDLQTDINNSIID